MCTHDDMNVLRSNVLLLQKFDQVLRLPRTQRVDQDVLSGVADEGTGAVGSHAASDEARIAGPQDTDRHAVVGGRREQEVATTATQAAAAAAVSLLSSQ